MCGYLSLFYFNYPSPPSPRTYTTHTTNTRILNQKEASYILEKKLQETKPNKKSITFQTERQLSHICLEASNTVRHEITTDISSFSQSNDNAYRMECSGNSLFFEYSSIQYLECLL